MAVWLINSLPLFHKIWDYRQVPPMPNVQIKNYSSPTIQNADINVENIPYMLCMISVFYVCVFVNSSQVGVIAISTIYRC